MSSVEKHLGSCRLNNLFLSSQWNDTCILSIGPFYHKVISFVTVYDLPYHSAAGFGKQSQLHFLFVYSYQAFEHAQAKKAALV